MKKAVIAVLVIVAGLFVYNYATTGELKLVPSFSRSEQEQNVADMADRFEAAKRQYAQALRSAGIAGIDTTADAEAASRSVEKLEAELATTRKQLTDERAIKKADKLAESVHEFATQLR